MENMTNNFNLSAELKKNNIKPSTLMFVFNIFVEIPSVEKYLKREEQIRTLERLEDKAIDIKIVEMRNLLKEHAPALSTSFAHP